MPKPYFLLEKLKKQRELVLEERKKKYVIDEIIENKFRKI